MLASAAGARHAFLVGIPHLRASNPHVAAVLTASIRPTAGSRQLAPAAALQLPGALTGASAFAFQGTNAHALVATARNLGFSGSSDGCATVTTTLPAVGVAARHWLTPAPHVMLRRVTLDVQIGSPGAMAGGLLRTKTLFRPCSMCTSNSQENVSHHALPQISDVHSEPSSEHVLPSG